MLMAKRVFSLIPLLMHSLIIKLQQGGINMSLPVLQIIPLWGYRGYLAGDTSIAKRSLVQAPTAARARTNAAGLLVSDPTYYLTEFQDNFDPRYNQVNTFGRMDPIMNYQGTGRKISFGLEVHDPTVGETMHKVMKKLMYPVYEQTRTITNALTIQRPPLVMVHFGNLIRDPVTKSHLLCALEAYQMTPTTGFTPLDSPMVRFGVGKEKITQFQKYSFRFDLVPMHSRALGFAGDSNPVWVGGEDL